MEQGWAALIQSGAGDGFQRTVARTIGMTGDFVRWVVNDIWEEEGDSWTLTITTLALIGLIIYLLWHHL